MLARKSLFLIPNFFTTLTLFFGFLSITLSQQGAFNDAALCVCSALITDLMDGLLARLTKTQSGFGEEYDSLADLIAFGVAPAVMVWHYAIDHGTSLAPNMFWLVSFLYVFAIAARLARFNSMQQNKDLQYFRGLPSPAAGALICCLVLLSDRVFGARWPVDLTLLLMVIFVSLCVVSTFAYPSLKRVDFYQGRPVLISLLIVLLAMFVIFDPLLSGMILLLVYLFMGPVISILRANFRYSLKTLTFVRWGRVIERLRKR